MKRLYVKCSSCNHVFPSGFSADSATQLVGFFHICPKCYEIVSCSPPEYLEKVNEGFRKSMKEQEIFAVPSGKRVEIMGPDVFELDKEVVVKPGVFLSSDRAIIRYKQATMMEEIARRKQKVRNSNLFKCLEDLTKAFIEGLDKPFFSSYGSWYDRVRILIRGDTKLVARILERRPDLEEEKLSRCLVSASRCLKALLEENIQRNPPHASTEDEYRDELVFFLEKLFKEKERIRTRGVLATSEALNRHFDRIFRQEYLRYENYLYRQSVSDFLIGQLQNFTCSESVGLENQLAISEITQEEFHSLVEANERYGYKLESYPKFVLYMPVENENWRRQLVRLITALRLLKKERIGLTRIHYAFALPCRAWKVIEAPTGTKLAEEPVGSSFDLSKTDEKELKHLWSLLDRAEEVGYLTISIRRFNFAYERKRLEDRWIDYFISLESLYSKAGELTEVTHRLATRVSRALTNGSLEDKKELRQKTKRWYVLRSKIVHGIQTDLNPEQLQDLEEVLRRSLKWFMSHQDYNNHDKIIDLLDLGS